MRHRDFGSTPWTWILGLALLTPVSPVWGWEPFPEDQLRPGMTGQVVTVLAGAVPETIPVEILGVIDNGIGPGVNLILGRLQGETGQFKGVAAGMSGSPVYIENRLVGALSYSIGALAKEPVCGITPIQHMLRLEDYPRGLLSPAAAAGWDPIPLALSVRGATPGALEGLDDLWRGLNLARRLQAVPSGGGSLAPAAEALQPGGAVAALLIWGDIQLGATGTITYREGDRLVAFGHPFLGSGKAAAPLAPAEIVWTVPSLANSFKIARIGQPAGIVDQDRLTGISGGIGPAPEGIEMRLTINRESRPAVNRQCFLIRDVSLTPTLAEAATRILLSDELGKEREEALRMKATIQLKDSSSVSWSVVAPGGPAGPPANGLGFELARQVNALLRPPVPLPDIARIEVTVTSLEPEGFWTLERATLDRMSVRPGETVRVLAELEGPRGRQRRVSLPLAIPADVPPGSYALLVGSPRILALEFGGQPETLRRTATGSREYINALNSIPPDDRLEVRLVLPAEGLITQGREYPALPGTAQVLLRSRPGGVEAARLRWITQAAADLPMERPVLQLARLELEVRAAEPSR